MKTVNILIVNNQGVPPEKKAPKGSAAQDAWKLQHVINSIPDVTAESIASHELIESHQLASYDGIVFSGSPTNLLAPGRKDGYTFRYYRLNFQSLINARVPIMGICGGIQLICDWFGIGLGEWPQEHDRKVRIQLLDHSGIFAGLPDQILGQEYHRQYVLGPGPGRGFPPESGLELTATYPLDSSSDDRTTVQGIRHKARHIYGTQFHPEYSGEHGTKILENFANICAEQS